MEAVENGKEEEMLRNFDVIKYLSTKPQSNPATKSPTKKRKRQDEQEQALHNEQDHHLLSDGEEDDDDQEEDSDSFAGSYSQDTEESNDNSVSSSLGQRLANGSLQILVSATVYITKQGTCHITAVKHGVYNVRSTGLTVLEPYIMYGGTIKEDLNSKEQTIKMESITHIKIFPFSIQDSQHSRLKSIFSSELCMNLEDANQCATLVEKKARERMQREGIAINVGQRMTQLGSPISKTQSLLNLVENARMNSPGSLHSPLSSPLPPHSSPHAAAPSTTKNSMLHHVESSKNKSNLILYQDFEEAFSEQDKYVKLMKLIEYVSFFGIYNSLQTLVDKYEGAISVEYGKLYQGFATSKIQKLSHILRNEPWCLLAPRIRESHFIRELSYADALAIRDLWHESICPLQSNSTEDIISSMRPDNPFDDDDDNQEEEEKSEGKSANKHRGHADAMQPFHFLVLPICHLMGICNYVSSSRTHAPRSEPINKSMFQPLDFLFYQVRSFVISKIHSGATVFSTRNGTQVREYGEFAHLFSGDKKLDLYPKTTSKKHDPQKVYELSSLCSSFYDHFLQAIDWLIEKGEIVAVRDSLPFTPRLRIEKTYSVDTSNIKAWANTQKLFFDDDDEEEDESSSGDDDDDNDDKAKFEIVAWTKNHPDTGEIKIYSRRAWTMQEQAIVSLALFMTRVRLKAPVCSLNTQVMIWNYCKSNQIPRQVQNEEEAESLAERIMTPATINKGRWFTSIDQIGYDCEKFKQERHQLEGLVDDRVLSHLTIKRDDLFASSRWCRMHWDYVTIANDTLKVKLNEEQKNAMRCVCDPSIPIVRICGPPGSGKTTISMALAAIVNESAATCLSKPVIGIFTLCGVNSEALRVKMGLHVATENRVLDSGKDNESEDLGQEAMYYSTKFPNVRFLIFTIDMIYMIEKHSHKHMARQMLRRMHIAIIDECQNNSIELFVKAIQVVCNSEVLQKMVLIGDTEQIHPISTGYPFLSLEHSTKIPVVTLVHNNRVVVPSISTSNSTHHGKTSNLIEIVNLFRECASGKRPHDQVDGLMNTLATFVVNQNHIEFPQDSFLERVRTLYDEIDVEAAMLLGELESRSTQDIFYINTNKQNQTEQDWTDRTSMFIQKLYQYHKPEYKELSIMSFSRSLADSMNERVGMLVRQIALASGEFDTANEQTPLQTMSNSGYATESFYSYRQQQYIKVGHKIRFLRNHSSAVVPLSLDFEDKMHASKKPPHKKVEGDPQEPITVQNANKYGTEHTDYVISDAVSNGDTDWITAVYYYEDTEIRLCYVSLLSGRRLVVGDRHVPLMNITLGYVCTVDSRMGSESKYVVLLLNSEKDLQWVDRRRLFVAMSRARSKMYIMCRETVMTCKELFTQLHLREVKQKRDCEAHLILYRIKNAFSNTPKHIDPTNKKVPITLFVLLALIFSNEVEPRDCNLGHYLDLYFDRLFELLESKSSLDGSKIRSIKYLLTKKTKSITKKKKKKKDQDKH